MEFNPVEHIRDLMHAEGINFHRLEMPLADLSRFDGELRRQLYADYDYADIRQELLAHCHPRTLYIVTDTFESRYIIFRDSARGEDNEAAFIIIGPYLANPLEVILPGVVEHNQLPAFQIPELKNYYSGVPCLPEIESSVLEAQLAVLVKYIFDTSQFQVSRTGFNLGRLTATADLQAEPTNRLSMSMIEERYRNEDGLLEAVERGDVQDAMVHMAAFRKYHLEVRNTDLVRNYKNFFIVLNSLLRKAVQRADVHPAHIDSLSAFFSRSIEAIRSTEELSRISPEMIRKYCLLVQNHSLRAYSKPIQRVINFVDFHLVDPLSLHALSDVAAVNPSYLSTQFKKETGTNLTDHISQKRIQKAIFLLNTTELPIHIIAERVGILDENYFSRLFKKVQGMSPREYRKSLIS